MPFPLAALAGGMVRGAAGVVGAGARGMGMMGRVGGAGGLGMAGRAGEAAWRIGATWDLANRIVESAESKFVSSFEAGITVMVRGGPEADIRRVWWLALSTAFGRYRNRVTGALNKVAYQGEWDITGKACKIEIFYSTNGLEQSASRFIDRAAALLDAGVDLIAGVFGRGGGGVPPIPAIDPTSNFRAFFQRGPEQLTVGGDFPDELRQGFRAARVFTTLPTWTGDPCKRPGPPFAEIINMQSFVRRSNHMLREFPLVVGRLVTGYPTAVIIKAGSLEAPVAGEGRYMHTLTADGNVTLPDDGRVITTGHKKNILVQPPAPLDGNSRNSLLALVSQSLETPCFLPPSPPCTGTWPGGAGRYVPGYTPGTNMDFASLGTVIQRTGAAIPVLDRVGGGGVPGDVDPNQVPMSASDFTEVRR